MNIGDKVRSLAGVEEGFVTKIMPGDQVEVEIEDGFRIPFMKRDLVVVSEAENKAFGAKPKPVKKATAASQSSASNTIRVDKGIFVAFTKQNDKLLEMHLINNTDLHLPFTFGEEKERNYYGLTAGGLKPKSSTKIHEVNIDKFERWPIMVLQILYHSYGYFKYKEPLLRRMKFKAATFFKSLNMAPILEKEAYLFQVDANIGVQETEKMKEKMLSGQQAESSSVMPKVKGSKAGKTLEVDLHLEAIVKNINEIPENNRLAVQLLHFEKKIDEAIIAGYDEVVFIHGVGGGTLRKEIQKRLGRNKNVDFFQDARKEKFGYGATLAKIK
ncbi:DUF2027 domain-containing protein [Flammeovirgaceae bacterium SG7u.111]|nr:DUF2027 domain-containing protein [Flammeovirgaceae bacterium SG7u.132]WPO37414.1 DUF2027 domain-containing protein [Flammeovirgaceae bacterium SG7u.111]